MIYVYHYSASVVIGNTVHSFDGIARMDHKITNMDDYRAFKKLILKTAPIDAGILPGRLTINSLSYLYESK